MSTFNYSINQPIFDATTPQPQQPTEPQVQAKEDDSYSRATNPKYPVVSSIFFGAGPLILIGLANNRAQRKDSQGQSESRNRLKAAVEDAKNKKKLSIGSKASVQESVRQADSGTQQFLSITKEQLDQILEKYPDIPMANLGEVSSDWVQRKVTNFNRNVSGLDAFEANQQRFDRMSDAELQAWADNAELPQSVVDQLNVTARQNPTSNAKPVAPTSKNVYNPEGGTFTEKRSYYVDVRDLDGEFRQVLRKDLLTYTIPKNSKARTQMDAAREIFDSAIADGSGKAHSPDVVVDNKEVPDTLTARGNNDAFMDDGKIKGSNFDTLGFNVKADIIREYVNKGYIRSDIPVFEGGNQSFQPGYERVRPLADAPAVNTATAEVASGVRSKNT